MRLKKDDIPEDMMGYGEASVFSEAKFEEIKLEVIDVAVLDDVLLTEEER